MPDIRQVFGDYCYRQYSDSFLSAALTLREVPHDSYAGECAKLQMAYADLWLAFAAILYGFEDA